MSEMLEMLEWIKNNIELCVFIAVLCGLSLIIRIKFKDPEEIIPSTETNLIAFVVDIIAVSVLMWFWGLGKDMEKYGTPFCVAFFAFTIFFVSYGLAKEIDKNNKLSESCLFFVKGFYLTFASFQLLLITIGYVLITVVISIIIYKRKMDESKMYFYDIMFLSIETIILSVIVDYYDICGIVRIVLYVFFVETVVFIINYIVEFYLNQRFS